MALFVSVSNKLLKEQLDDKIIESVKYLIHNKFPNCNINMYYFKGKIYGPILLYLAQNIGMIQWNV